MTFKVSKASLDDAKAIYLLVKSTREFAASRKTRHFGLDELKAWMGKRNCIVLVAKQDGVTAGFLFGMVISKDWFMLDSLVVARRYRGRGVARLLLDRMYFMLRRRAITYVQGLVNVECVQTRAFWRHEKFSEGNQFMWIERYL